MRAPAGSVAEVSAPKALSGALTVPGDKSISHRAGLLNAIADGRAVVRNYAPGADCQSTLTCLRGLGVPIAYDAEGNVLVDGFGLDGLREPAEVLDCGNSGTTMRLLAGLLASRPFLSILSGDASLRSRPMSRVIQPLRAMGTSIWARDGDRLAPLAIRGGQLAGTRYEMPIASAQVKSSLLLAGLGAQGGTTVAEPAPSRDHTERMLGAMGVEISRAGREISVVRVPDRLRPLSMTVPGDFSSAAFWLAAACAHPNAEVRIREVGLNPGRIGLLAVLREMGARVQVVDERLEGGEPIGDLVAESSELRAVEVGGDLIPSLIDELPLLAVLGCFARGASRVRDAAELRHKESDRIAAMVSQLSRMGARIDEHPDGWTVQGPCVLAPAEVDAGGDHRVAMALAVAALAAGRASISGAECVGISYPSFWQDGAALGGHIRA